MTKHLNKRIFSVLLTAVLLATAMAPVLLSTRVMNDANAADPLEAVPTIVNSITAIAGNTKDAVQISTSIPIYSIKQYNGWSSNYMKLRDIAYYLDFDVVWNPDEPNAMRLYTNRHYLDNWVAPGPATQTKQATLSTMDIYVDDVKVTANVQPVMIDFNNYFKVRDIATIMNFWCEFGFSGNGKNYVKLDANHTYVDEKTTNELQAMDWSDRERIKDAQYKRVMEYESLVWYSGEIGAVSDKPVTYSLRDAWGNYDYTKLYFGVTDPELNAMAQLMLDRNVISKDSSGVRQFNDGNKLNAYYQYPMIRYKTSSYNAEKNNIFSMTNRPSYEKHSSNFGANVVIRPLNGKETSSELQVGIASIEYDLDSETAKARAATKKYAASILAEMDKLSCDAEKIQYLAWATTKKLMYADKTAAEVTAVDRQKAGVPLTAEIADLPTDKDWESWAKIWADNKIYVAVCDHYCTVFEGLCNAAGYYFVGDDESRSNHVFDIVWVPDEGRWVNVDCSAIDIGNSVGYSGAGVPVLRERVYTENGEWKYTENWPSSLKGGARILSFFYMMEQIKPGGWLSSDPMQNP